MVDRKQLDFGVACRAGNANRFCEPRARRRERERETERERLTVRGSQAVPLLCRRPYVERKDRVVRAQRKREDEV